MAKLIDTKPDKIEQTHRGQYRFYFTGGKDLVNLRVGAQYVIMYEPSIYSVKGWVVHYEIAQGPGTGPWAKEIQKRPLTDEEIAHFAGLIGGHGGGA